MVRLRNIKRDEKIIEADYFPEGKEDFGHVAVDIKTKEIISVTMAKEDLECYYDTYFGFAARRLRELIDAEELPETCLVMWY